MPPIDDEFIRSLARSIVGMLLAVETGDKLLLIGELNLLLTALVERGTAETREAAALTRAVERVR